LQVVRIQSPDAGTKRIDTKGNESVAEFLNKVMQIKDNILIFWLLYISQSVIKLPYNLMF
jgi:hypothetical protein